MKPDDTTITGIKKGKKESSTNVRTIHTNWTLLRRTCENTTNNEIKEKGNPALLPRKSTPKEGRFMSAKSPITDHFGLCLTDLFAIDWK